MVVFALGLTRIDTPVQLLKLFCLGRRHHRRLWLARNAPRQSRADGVGHRLRSVGLPHRHRGCRNRGHAVPDEPARATGTRRAGPSQSREPRGRGAGHCRWPPLSPSIPSSGTHLVKVGQRFATNSQLEEHYRNELLSTEFLAEEPVAAGAVRDDRVRPDPSRQFWRISARVAALSDVDYGEFVAELRAVGRARHGRLPRPRSRVGRLGGQAEDTLRHSRIAIVTTVPADAETNAAIGTDPVASPTAWRGRGRRFAWPACRGTTAGNR